MGRSEHQNRRAALPQAGALLRACFDHAADALLLQDETETVLDVNRQACAELGYTRRELIGKSLREVATDPGSQRSSMGASGSRFNEDAVAVEKPCRRKDGTGERKPPIRLQDEIENIRREPAPVSR
jgi:PAS domain S-box-containing protein